MVDEQDPAKRVVKRVVKKTVVRPAAPAQASPPVRYGRPVATAIKPQAKAQPRPEVTAPGGKVPTGKIATKAAPRPKVPRERPNVDLAARTAAARELAGRAWWATADTVSGGARTGGRLVATATRTASAWRLPHLNPYLASLITGAVVGVVAVALGAGALAIFQDVRGVSSGGGLWGGLTFVVVAVASLLLGEALLRGFGTHSARLTSFFAVILTIIAMLGLFPDLIDSSGGLLVVPVLGVVAYVLSHWLVDLAENAPTVVE
jgi:hypothetical protein|nr:hypothetical protein [Aeromicrobium sp.]